jgi:hypothetical protein
MYNVDAYKFNQNSKAERIDFKEPEIYLDNVYRTPFHMDLNRLLESGFLRWMGWSYDFRKYLTRYIIKTEHCGLCESYAPNKTLLRKVFQGKGYGKIIYITEAPKQ